MVKSNVVRLAVPADAPRSRGRGWQGEDDVFFHRSQLHIGTELVDFGRLKHNTKWVVVEFRVYKTSRAGNVRAKRVYDGSAINAGLKLIDDVVLRRVGGNEVRTIGFSRLSYSATWRIG
jgi:hypothetical protein